MTVGQRLVPLIAGALLALAGSSNGRPAQPPEASNGGHQTLLLQEKEINQQISLIEKLVKIMLNVTDCQDADGDKGVVGKPTNATIQETDEKDPDDVQTPDPSECEYAELSPEHTALKGESECEVHVTGLSPQDRKHVLKLHNELRAKVARGEETRGSPGPQPPAANMKEMVWNEELAYVAQAWASQCPRGHDQARNRRICSRDYQVGQNIYYYWGFNEEPDWKQAVNQWYDEVADMPKEFASSFQLLKTKKIGHYTQVVWADTSEIGCGVVHYETEKNGKYYPESKTYVCNYGRAGNVRERPIYKQGPAASVCPKGVSQNYTDLCA